MGNASEEHQYLTELDGYIRGLAEALPFIEDKIGRPNLVPIKDDPTGEHFRYADPSERIIQVLLLVRIVSGCHATLLLLLSGHIVEAGVLVRTIDDFIGDFAFVEDAVRNPNGPNVTQKKFLDNFFLESTDPKKQHVGRTQKVQAAEARRLSPDNPNEVGELSRNIDNVYDAHVHGDYGPVMDLYVGQQDGRGGRFEALGVTAAEATAIHRLVLAAHIHQAYSVALQLSIHLGLRDVNQGLYRIYQSFEGKDVFDKL